MVCIMKYKDIVYKISDELMAPDAMGIVEADIFDWSTPCKCYVESIPAVEKAVELCTNFDSEENVANIITDEIPPEGFCKRYVYFFIIEAAENIDIVYYPYIPGSEHRHWLNGKLAFIGNTLSVYTISLKKGRNIFCVEKFTEGVPFVRIQVKNYASHTALLSLTENNYWYKPSNFEIVHDKHIQNGEPFQFTLIPLDLINLNYDSIVNMTIQLGEEGPILYERKVTFKETYKMDLSFIPNMREDECERLYVYFRVKDKNGRISEKYTYLFRHNINPAYIKDLKEQASCILEQTDVPELLKDEIRFYTRIMTDQITYYYFGYLLKKMLKAAEDNALNNYLFSPGAHNVYYYSNINNEYHHYYVVLPKDFDSSKKYPLLLTFQFGHVNNFESIHHSSNFSAHFADREGAIYADIGGDGCTMGSYTGEVFLLTEIEHLLKNFPVDRKRVYAIANCAGNIAALNFVETYPHLFAGIYTRSADITKNSIGNLYNIHCMYVFSGQDNWVLKDTKFIKKKLNNVEFIYSDKYLDRYIDLILSQYTVSAIDHLMTGELDEYPENIHYRTVRNRARRAYYIEIESIKRGKSFAEFSSKIEGQNLVILTKNCTGLKITLPPQMERNYFTIDINGKSLVFSKYEKDEVFLHQYPRKGFEVVKNINEGICYYKGTGLIDVYLSSMRVVNCDTNDNQMAKVSNAFANPTTFTIAGTITRYPTISIEDIPNNLDCALTIVDNNCELNESLNYIRSMLPIQMDSYGYNYKGKAIPGDYCILQVIANPWYNDKSILYINTNNKDLYTKNIITRKLKIPSYSSGYHPFLNGVALLFDGNIYYSIKEWGNDITIIK